MGCTQSDLIETPQQIQNSQKTPDIQRKGSPVPVAKTPEADGNPNQNVFSQSQSGSAVKLPKPMQSGPKPLPQLVLKPITTPAPLPRPGSQTGTKKDRVLIDDYAAHEQRQMPKLQEIDRDQLEDNALVLEAKRDIEKLYGPEYVNDQEMIRALVEKKKQRVKVDPKALQRRVDYKCETEDKEEEEIQLIMKIKQMKQKEQRQLLEEVTRDTEQRKQLNQIKSKVENEDETELAQRRKSINPMQEQLQKEIRKGQRGTQAYQKPPTLRPLTASRPKLQSATSEVEGNVQEVSMQQEPELDRKPSLEPQEHEPSLEPKDDAADDDSGKALREMLGEV